MEFVLHQFAELLIISSSLTHIQYKPAVGAVWSLLKITFSFFSLHFPTVGHFFLTGQKKISWLETGIRTLWALNISLLLLFVLFVINKYHSLIIKRFSFSNRPTPAIEPEILRTMVVRHFIGYAPNPGIRKRNQVIAGRAFFCFALFVGPFCSAFYIGYKEHDLYFLMQNLPAGP